MDRDAFMETFQQVNERNCVYELITQAIHTYADLDKPPYSTIILESAVGQVHRASNCADLCSQDSA